MIFVQHKLTEDEIRSGMVLTTLQKQVLQNRICELATELVLAPASRADETYFDKHNMLKGQIAELQSMLAASDMIEQDSTNTAKE